MNGYQQVDQQTLDEFISRFTTEEALEEAYPRCRAEMAWAEKLARDKSPEERLALKVRAVIQREFGLPRKVNLEAIASCPLRCGFCTVSNLKPHRRKPRMTLDDFKSIWSSMSAFTTEVEFTGGEPLLNKAVFDMIEVARSSGTHTTLTTNAFLLNEERVDEVLRCRPDRILIAFDGVSEEEYLESRIRSDFGKVAENVGLMVERKRQAGGIHPEISLQMVVSRKNIESVDEFWKLAEKIGVDSAATKPVLVWPDAGEAFNQKMIDEYLMPEHEYSYHTVDENGRLAKTRKPGICPNVQNVHIGTGGEVIPCWYLLKNDFIAGYVGDEHFLDIWNSERYRAHRREMVEGQVSPGCEHCIGISRPELFIYRRFAD